MRIVCSGCGSLFLSPPAAGLGGPCHAGSIALFLQGHEFYWDVMTPPGVLYPYLGSLADMDLFKSVQRGATTVIRVLESRFCEDRLGQLFSAAWRREGSGRSSCSISIYKVGSLQRHKEDF